MVSISFHYVYIQLYVYIYTNHPPEGIAGIAHFHRVLWLFSAKDPNIMGLKSPILKVSFANESTNIGLFSRETPLYYLCDGVWMDSSNDLPEGIAGIELGHDLRVDLKFLGSEVGFMCLGNDDAFPTHLV